MNAEQIFEAMVRGLDGDAISEQVDAVLRGEFDGCNNNAVKIILDYADQIREVLPQIAERLDESAEVFKEYEAHA